MSAHHPASLRQIEAADPAACTWLSANAGSGKTRVLTDRVARLLLGGVAPQSILCLTYTKAAAGEMQNRLFARLGEWAMLPEPALRTALADLGIDAAPDPATLARARRLFARAIETPGGLKIQTIHAFCAGLLRRFPLEAGVSPRFSEIDDRADRMLADEVLEALAEGDPAAFDALAAHLGGDDLAKLTAEIVTQRAALAQPAGRDTLLATFGLPAGFGAADLLAEAIDAETPALLDAVVPVLAAGSTTDARAAARLAGLRLDPPDLGALMALEGVVLFGAKADAPFAAKIGSFPTKATRARLGNLLAPLEGLMARVEATRPRRLALAATEKTQALHRFAAAFLPERATRMEARGQLGFDDLIARAQGLLADPSVAQWVLYKLDGGVDHILVDEAQDTSPEQWAVIEQLAAELTAGDGGRRRTLFVVGDRKQSIYSFQGADLRAFDRMRGQFSRRLAEARVGLNELTLEHSFRSSAAVLRVVDLTFDAAQGRGLGGEVGHIAFHADLPGRVDLWPAIPKAETPDDPEWWEPVDILTEEHAVSRLARAVAAEIGRMLRAGTPLPQARGGPRPVRPGDFLILVRRRSALFHRLIAACKAEGLPIAGADRMALGAELAVRDLTALLSFLATPEDDLALATVLRSPLGGWSEGDLHDLAHGRAGYLWAALRAHATRPDTLEMLTDLRDQADYLRPFELLERVLTRHGGRTRLLARLGPEAEEGVDALLAQALAYETTEVPGLTGFLGWLAADEVQVKRRADGAGDRIRVMTVHGAKGLEAPVVILPDTAVQGAPRERALLRMAGGQVGWRVARADSPPALAEAAAEAEAARAEEDARLLYVAMTRSECWLILAAAGEVEGDSWHARVAAGMEAAGAVRAPFPTGEGLRVAHGVWPTEAPATPPPAPATPAPAWAALPPPPVPEPPAPLSPSGLGGAKALPGEGARDEAAAMRRGRLLHLLLEHLPTLPPADWAMQAPALLASGDDAAPADEALALLEEARAVLAAPDLAELFSPDALAEVEIAADLGGRRLIGTIDRLLVRPDRVLAVDWKTNVVVPDRPEDVPEGLLRQMAAYAHALAQVYPDRPVETALLWTRTARLMPLPPALLAPALARALAELPVPRGIDPGPRGP